MNPTLSGLIFNHGGWFMVCAGILVLFFGRLMAT
jgi:hypothetical protein